MHDFRYLALGDSYTIGESVGESDRFPEQLAAELRRRGFDVAAPEIIARTGWTTDELNAAIDARAPRGPYDLVTLLIGVNNQYRGRDAENYREEFRGLLQRAIAFGGGAAHVIVVSIPDWGVTPFAANEGRDSAKVARDIDVFNAAARDEATSRGVAFVDITPQSRLGANDDSLLAGDGLHPSAKMYRQWTEALLPHAVRILNAAKHRPKARE